MSISHYLNRRMPEAAAFAASIKETNMRFMILIKAGQDSEAGVMPSEQQLAEMGQFNEALARAGRSRGRRRLAAEFERCPGAFFRGRACRHARAFPGVERTHCRVLDMEVRFSRGGDPVGKTLPQSDAERLNNRDSAGIRGRRLRRSAYARTARTRSKTAGANGSTIGRSAALRPPNRAGTR